MAQRRMFSHRILNSARFLKMPHEAQNLYFHLCMNADDDGVVEAYTVIKMVGAKEDVIRVLFAKGFVYPLSEEDIVYISDWREHNLIRADRKIDSIHKELLLRILPEIELVEPQKRADRPPKELGRPMDNHGTAQVRLGKVSKEDVFETKTSPLRSGTPNTTGSGITYKNLDDDGNVRPERKVSQGKSAGVYFKLQNSFIERCKKELGITPAPAAKNIAMLKFAMEKGGLNETSVKDLIEDWFSRTDKTDEQLVQMTQMLSAANINTYKVRNSIKT